MANKKGKTISDVIRGDDRRINLTFLQSDKTTAIDLTGGTVYFTVNATADPTSDSSAVIQKTATTFTSATTGKHTFTLSHSDTNITPGTYYYDAQLVDSTGGYLSAYRGLFVVQPDTTRT